ncbi:MarR family winged helix-turn-helix transcriptional regulator [Lactiplantibacillus carotarum]|uniref:MarR family winged helix-turn-helix transcriptional regulator n=1 Tax=Lactiplantibacillus carotarum TaxID=2993456 RepID=UPI00298EF184|nr:MarR family winged helix-turn-helix transcriptional regulator [Lactiplantibacillus carotarum]
MALEEYPIGKSIINLVSAHRLVTTAKISKLGLHAGQDLILLALLEQDGQSQNALVQQLCVNHSAVAKSVARMQKNDILTTQKSTVDKRVTLVFLTSKGRQLALQTQQVWQNVESIAFDHLSETDQADFLRLIAIVERNFEENA